MSRIEAVTMSGAVSYLGEGTVYAIDPSGCVAMFSDSSSAERGTYAALIP